MLNVTSIRTQVIYPALNKMGMWSEAAGELVLGTAIVESNLTYLKQHGDGPALGLWQVQPKTHEDLYANYLNYRPEMMSSLMELRSPSPQYEREPSYQSNVRRSRVQTMLLSETRPIT